MPLARSCAQHACFLTGCQASHDVLVSSPARRVTDNTWDLGSDTWDHACRSARHAGLVEPQELLMRWPGGIFHNASAHCRQRAGLRQLAAPEGVHTGAGAHSAHSLSPR